ncbi:hypothetical protein MNBD_PLANCTO02-2026 [hydrothermal vent metagenome]|uniref:Glycosyltransferase n=1 Tax=hydrothermal vent metagenome TaxID=652676 RepID=A0A3B1DC36_9ZZZZ
MLAVIDALQGDTLSNHLFQWNAIAPEVGPLAEALQKRSIPITSCPLIDNTTSHRFPPDIASERLLNAIQKQPADIVHANSLSMGRLLGRIAPRLPMPTVSHIRDIMKLSKAAISDLNQNSSLIAVSQATKDFHLQQGIPEKQLQVIYNGVDCHLFQPRPSTKMLHNELKLPPETFLIASIGQIGLRKGQNFLAKAAVQTSRKMPNAHYLMIGERHSSKQESIDFKQNIISQFAQAGISHRLHWLGFRNDVFQLLNEIDLLVHPAHQEPLGRVLLEASAAGTPIVATDVGGTTEILKHQHSALLVPAGNTTSLVTAIQTVYDNPLKRKELANNARKNVIHKFSIEQVAEKMKHFWCNISPSHRASRHHSGNV